MLPQQSCILDCRPAADFQAGHLPGSSNIPQEKLPGHLHELPASGASLTVVDTHPQRLAEAADFLQVRGLNVVSRLLATAELCESGPACNYLWSPTPLLREALSQYDIPRGPAVDLACGTGRDAAFVAMHGFEVEAVDVLPDALAKAASLARHCGASITTRQHDLRQSLPLPVSHYALVTLFRYLHRPLLPQLPTLLRPRGVIIVETFHARTAETPAGPKRASHLLKTGELAATFASLQILHAQDEVERDGRYFSQIIARKN